MSAAGRSRGGPDQGWAWVVALSCFFINFIMAGLARTAGVLYVALIDLYGVSRESATTPFSVRVCVRNMAGPIIGLLGQRFGIRPITTIGALFAAAGGILCFVAPDVFWITIFWGGIHGMGFGLSTVLHMMVIHQYFEKYKASALGFAYSGDCFGTFAFPVVLELLISNYGVKGTFLILGGIVLNVLPAALLLKPPPWLRENRRKSISPSDRFNQDLCGQNPDVMEIIPRSNSESKTISSIDTASQPSQGPLKNVHRHDYEMANILTGRPLSTVQIPSASLGRADYQKSVIDSKMDYLEIESYRNVSFQGSKAQETINNAINRSLNEKARSPEDGCGKWTPDRCPKDERISTTNCDAKTSLFLTVLRVNVNPMFNVISLTLAVYAFLFVGVITIIIDYGIDKGVSPEEGKYLVIGFSIADLVGRMGFGGFVDKKLISIRSYVTITVVTMGALVVCIPWASTFPVMIAIMALYGLVQGGVAIIFPILIGNYMTRKEEHIAMGCMNFYSGSMMLGLAPMIGFFRDYIGSYDGVFYVSGGMTVFMGFFWLLEPIIVKRQKSRRAVSSQSSIQGDLKVTERSAEEKF